MNLLGKIFVSIVALSCFVGTSMEWPDYLQGRHAINESRRTVLETPVQLDQGSSILKPFTVDVETTYAFDIECQKSNSPDAFDTDLANQLTIKFAVTNDVGSLVHEDLFQSGGITEKIDHVDRHISTFKALPNTHYYLIFNVLHSSPTLEKSQSVLKISMNARAFENLCMATSMSAYKAIGLGLAGLLCLLVFLDLGLCNAKKN